MDEQGTEKMQILAEAEASPVSVYSVPRTAIYYSLSESELRMLERGYSSVSLAVATTCGGIFATTALGLLTLHLDTRPFAVSVAICVATGFVALQSGLRWYQEKRHAEAEFGTLLQERKRTA